MHEKAPFGDEADVLRAPLVIAQDRPGTQRHRLLEPITERLGQSLANEIGKETETLDEGDEFHPKRIVHKSLLILTTQDEIDQWLTAPTEEALKLQRPLPDGSPCDCQPGQ